MALKVNRTLNSTEQAFKKPPPLLMDNRAAGNALQDMTEDPEASEAGGALVSKAFIWDLAAAAAILKARGGILRYLNGQPVEFADLLNASLTPEPLLSAAPEIIPFLSERIFPKT